MVLTIIIIIVMLVIGFGLVALYREVGLGREGNGNGGERFGAQPPPSGWPLGNLSVGSHVAIPTEEAYTGFVALCADDDDAFREIYPAAVVAEDWGYPFLVAIAKTAQPDGWIDRIDNLPGHIGTYDMRVDQMRALQPVRLPVLVFVNEGRLLDASARLDSPGEIVSSFQHCRFGLPR
jgi:hypothetical protein